jgi:hypothetical protein
LACARTALRNAGQRPTRAASWAKRHAAPIAQVPVREK